MNKIFFCFIVVLLAGCASNTPMIEKETVPVKEQNVSFFDIQNATKKCIEDLITKNALKVADGSKAFVMVDNFNNSIIAGVPTDSLDQDVRLKILMSDQAVTMPAPEKKNNKDAEKETQKKLKDCDYFLTGGIKKVSVPAADDGDKLDFFVVSYQLKDLKTGKVVWQCEEKLVRESD